MRFFNSLFIRIPLALVGGILYGLLTHLIVTLLGLPGLALPAVLLVFLLYVGSRFLILFSGIDSAYHYRGERVSFPKAVERNAFYETTQWVGKFYHYHDLVLFAFLTMLAITFLILFFLDWSSGEFLGNTIGKVWETISSAFQEG